VPSLWQTIEQQSQLNGYKFDSFVRGTNLDGERWVCYYFFYELDMLAKFGQQRS